MLAAANKQKIINYYNQTTFDYQVVWAMGSQRSLHYGLWGKHVHTLRQALANENVVLADMAQITARDHVLDAGCGVGGSSLYLARHYGCKVMGISIVESQIKSANSSAKKLRLANLATFKTADYTATPLAANTFDVVWAVESICHTPEKCDFLLEAYRVLKPGGRLIIAEYLLRNNPLDNTAQAVVDQWLSGWAIESLDTARDFVAKAKAVGFTDVKLQDFTARILPSAKRMYQSTFITAPFERFTRTVGWRGPAGKGNFVAARLQYQAFKRGLCLYGVVTAIKSGVRK